MDNTLDHNSSANPESLQYFDRPFSELMIWAVLTKRQVGNFVFKYQPNKDDRILTNVTFFSNDIFCLSQIKTLHSSKEMAQLMWQHGEESIAKALVACTLYNAMAYEAEDDDLDVEIYEELIKYAEEFQNHALNVRQVMIIVFHLYVYAWQVLDLCIFVYFFVCLSPYLHCIYICLLIDNHIMHGRCWTTATSRMTT